MYLKNALKCKGELVTISNHKIHVYRQGNINAPKLVFMAGSATVVPVYDFKVLYEKLVDDFRIIVTDIKVIISDKAIPTLKRGQNSFEGGCSTIIAWIFKNSAL